MLEIRIPNTNKRFLVQFVVYSNDRDLRIFASMDITCGNMADVHGIVHGQMLEKYQDAAYEITCILKYFL